MQYLRSKGISKGSTKRSEEKKIKEINNPVREKDHGGLESSKHGVIDNPEHNNKVMVQSKRLLSESKDILSDGSDSDALVIDMGML